MIIDLTDVPAGNIPRKALSPVTIDWLPTRPSDNLLVMRGEFGICGVTAFAVRPDRNECEALDMLLCDAKTQIGAPATEGCTGKYGGYVHWPAAQAHVDPEDYADYGTGDDNTLHFTDDGAYDIESYCSIRNVSNAIDTLPYEERLSLALALIKKAIEDLDYDMLGLPASTAVCSVMAGAVEIRLPRFRHSHEWTWLRSWHDWNMYVGSDHPALPIVCALVEAGIELETELLHGDDGQCLGIRHILTHDPECCAGPASFESDGSCL